MQSICVALRENALISLINFNFNGVGNEGAIMLSELLQNSNHVTELHLANNGILDEGFVAMAMMLEENFTLRVLNLSG